MCVCVSKMQDPSYPPRQCTGFENISPQRRDVRKQACLRPWPPPCKLVLIRGGGSVGSGVSDSGVTRVRAASKRARFDSVGVAPSHHPSLHGSLPIDLITSTTAASPTILRCRLVVRLHTQFTPEPPSLSGTWPCSIEQASDPAAGEGT